MARIIEHGIDPAFLDNAAGIHHGNTISQPRDDGEIMRNPDQSCACLGTELLHFSENLRLDRHIKRSRGFIRNQQRRAHQERNGNRNALAHAA